MNAMYVLVNNRLVQTGQPKQEIHDMRMMFMAVMAILLSTGCATKPQYFNSLIVDSAQAERQLAIDDGQCTLAASGIRVPQIPVGPGGQAFSGTATSGNTTFNYSGTTEPVGGFSSGFAKGANMRNAMEARDAKDKIHRGCMLSKGWSDRPTR